MRWIVVAALMGTASPVLAQNAGEAACTEQAGLVMQVVAARSAGMNVRRAERRVQRNLTEELKKYDRFIGHIAQWVYSLPEDQLGTEVGTAFEAQCKAAL